VAYLSDVNPIVNPRLSADGRLSFENAAVAAKAASEPSGGYLVEWARFDNATGVLTQLGSGTTDGRAPLAAPIALPDGGGTFVRVRITAANPPVPSWKAPVDAYFRRTTAGWQLVGLDRRPA
jgi:hypothetical protein